MELGQKYLTELKYEDAIFAFQKVIEMDPKNEIVYINSYNVYVDLNDTENAVVILEQGYRQTNSEQIADLLEFVAIRIFAPV